MKTRSMMFLTFLTACSGAHGASEATGAPGASADCSSIPKVQGAAQACCSTWGIDACGPGLFCAALDGRTVEACYADGSRKGGQSCTADEQCEGSSCDVAVGVCPPSSGFCDPTVGCAGLRACVQLCQGDPSCPPPQCMILCTSDLECAPGTVCSPDHLCPAP